MGWHAPAGRGGQDSDGASRTGSYEVTAARLVACSSTTSRGRRIRNKTAGSRRSGEGSDPGRWRHLHPHCQAAGRRLLAATYCRSCTYGVVVTLWGDVTAATEAPARVTVTFTV